MHSSRIRTARSSGRPGGGLHTPLGADTPPLWPHPPNFPPGCGPGNLQGMLGYPPPRDLCFLLQGMLGYPPRDLLQGILGYHLQYMLGYHPSPPNCGQNSWHNASENITLPQTSFAGGNNSIFHSMTLIKQGLFPEPQCLRKMCLLILTLMPEAHNWAIVPRRDEVCCCSDEVPTKRSPHTKPPSLGRRRQL